MIIKGKYPEPIKKYIDNRRKMLSDGSLPEDFGFDLTQVQTLIESLVEKDKKYQIYERK